MLSISLLRLSFLSFGLCCAEIDHILRLAAISTGDDEYMDEAPTGWEPWFGPQHMLYRIAFHGVAFNRGLIPVQRMVEVEVSPIIKLALQANHDARCPRASDPLGYAHAKASIMSSSLLELCPLLGVHPILASSLLSPKREPATV